MNIGNFDLSQFSGNAMIITIVSMLLPLLTQWINQQTWPDWVEGAITPTAALVTGVADAFIKGGLSGFDWGKALATALVAWLVALLAHVGIWKNTDVANKLAVKGFAGPTLNEDGTVYAPKHTDADDDGLADQTASTSDPAVIEASGDTDTPTGPTG